MPAPDTFQSGLISAMLTSMPALRSRMARVLPAIPPPTMRMLRMADSSAPLLCLLRNAPGALAAETADRRFHYVAGPQQPAHGQAVAGRAAGQHQVARQQSRDLRRVRDQPGDAEDHVLRRLVLHDLAVEPQGEPQAVRITGEAGGHQVRAQRGESGGVLAA